VRADNWSNVATTEILLGNTSMSPNYWSLNILDKLGAPTMENGVWHKFTFSKADFTLQTGSLDWANTQDMIVRASSS